MNDLERRAVAAMPSRDAWFCGGCGCYPWSQDHAPDCVESRQIPRFSMRYVPLEAVIEALEQGYAPQNPSPAHPADYVTKRFLGEGHEGIALGGER